MSAVRGGRQRGLLLSALGLLMALGAGLAIAVAAQSWYLKREVISGRAFTARAVNVVAEPRVQAAVSMEISDVLAEKTGLAVGDIGPTVSQALDSRSFNSLLRNGARRFNAALFHNALHGQSFSVGLRGLVKSNRIPASVLDDTTVQLVSARTGSALRDTNDAADALRVLCIALPLAALFLLAIAIGFTARPARALSAAGFAAAAAGAVTLPVLAHLRTRTIDTLSFSHTLSPKQDATIATAIWNGFFGSMHTIAVASLVGGAALCVVLMLWGALGTSRSRA